MIWNKQFEEWFTTKKVRGQCWMRQDMGWFYSLQFSMQWGVYLEFFDSVGMDVGCMKSESYDESDYNIYVDDKFCKEINGTRQEAQQEAVKKASEILDKI